MGTQDQAAEAVFELSHSAWGEFIKGNPEPAKRLFSRGEDVSVENPFDPFVRGWSQVEAVMERAAQNWREGEVVGFELIAKYATDNLTCFVEVERYRAKVGGSFEPASVALRVTTVVRREGHDWKIVCRHAGPITSPRPAESVIQPLIRVGSVLPEGQVLVTPRRLNPDTYGGWAPPTLDTAAATSTAARTRGREGLGTTARALQPRSCPPCEVPEGGATEHSLRRAQEIDGHGPPPRPTMDRGGLRELVELGSCPMREWLRGSNLTQMPSRPVGVVTLKELRAARRCGGGPAIRQVTI